MANPQFITNEQGDRIFAVLPIDDYYELAGRGANDAPVASHNADASEGAIDAQAGLADDRPMIGDHGGRDGNLTVDSAWNDPTPVQGPFFFWEKRVKASSRYEGRRLVIQKGSGASLDESESFRNFCSSTADRRRALIQRGVLVADNGRLVFTEDVGCDSPTEAAGLVCGNSRNGWDAWVDAGGRPLKEVLPDDAFPRRRRGR